MEGEDILKHIVFSPSKSITFQPLCAKQKTDCEITNNSSIDIIVKWKLTRPGVFRTSPTYCIVKPGETVKTILTCAGIAKEEAAVNRDRFSVIVAPIGSTDLLPRSIWKDQEILKKLSIGKIQKKVIFILYAGINDDVILENQEVNELEDLEEEPKNEQLSESLRSSDLKTTRTAGNFTCQLIPIEQLAPAKTVKSPS